MSKNEDHARRERLAEEPELLKRVEQNLTAQPEAIAEGDEIVAQVEHYIRRFTILPTAGYLTVAIWTIATYIAKLFDCFPYLALLSPVKRCGKTRLLEILEQLVAHPWRGTAPTPAALFRMMALGPTLLLDEVEVFNIKNQSEAGQTILAILNAGHRKGATIPRCEGSSNNLRHFPIYGPKAFAAIGRLPDTLTDRSICLTIQRRAPTESIERFLLRSAKADADPIRQSVAGFLRNVAGDISQAYAHLVQEDLKFLGDRDADLWLPLFATCSVVAPSRMHELKSCAEVLSRGKASQDIDDSLSTKLLADIREVWPGEQDRCETAVLIDRLKNLDESPWGEKLDKRQLARMLRPFRVEPRQIWIETKNVRGYARNELLDAFARYLPSREILSARSTRTRVNAGEKRDFASARKTNSSG